MEKWKTIPGWKGKYEVSDTGLVRSLDTVVPDKRTGTRKLKGRLLKQIKMDKGYLYVGMCAKNKVKLVAVHVLVLRAFVGPAPPGMVCRHFPDRNPQNNKLTNLQWGTLFENANDRKVHGTQHQPKPEESHLSKVNWNQVHAVRKHAKQGKLTQREIGKLVGLSQPAVWKIIHNVSWKE